MASLAQSHIGATARDAAVAVLGYGISNRPLVDCLLALHSRVTVYDRRPLDELGETAAAHATRGVVFTTSLEQALTPAPALIFRTPGLRPIDPAIVRAVADGSVITSEMAWFLESTDATVIGITGSDGKTTTSTLTAMLLEESGHRVYLGGNIGQPLLPLAEQMKKDDFAVVELSSFQLYDLPAACVPHRAALTNLTPNHLNWHPDMEEYILSKTHIYQGDRCQRLVTNAGNHITADLAQNEHGRREVVLFGAGDGTPTSRGDETIRLENGVIVCKQQGENLPLLDTADIRLAGRHNIENYMCALGLVYDLVTPAAIQKIASTFEGVAHRLQPVRIRRGVTYYDSSIDSTPIRTAAALSALSCPVVLICGGADKKTDYDYLAKLLCRRVRAVVLTGQTAPRVKEALNVCPDYDERRLLVCHHPLFVDAVHAAADLAKEGEAVLLSPAFTSYDAFPNFEVRGDTFIRLVNELPD